MANRLSTLVNKINLLPKASHRFLLTKLFTSQVKFAGTAKLAIHSISAQDVTVALANKKRVQNHIGGIHAVAAALAAESASGIVFGMNVPDSHLPLLKSMTLNFNRRMQGAITVHARLSDEQITTIHTNDKGDVTVAVYLTDESGEEPIQCVMNWAWTPKKK